MRRFMSIVESAERAVLPATPEYVAKAKAFLVTKWRERATEVGRAEPADLSQACKFAALFAQAIFGGKIMANDYHTWVVLDGRVLDLAEDAEDAALMRRGTLPDYAKEYARNFKLQIPQDGDFAMYEPNPVFMQLPGFKLALRGNKPRVRQWAAQFRRLLGGQP
jgi:hypothetical protein